MNKKLKIRNNKTDKIEIFYRTDINELKEKKKKKIKYIKNKKNIK